MIQGPNSVSSYEQTQHDFCSRVRGRVRGRVRFIDVTLICAWNELGCVFERMIVRVV